MTQRFGRARTRRAASAALVAGPALARWWTFSRHPLLGRLLVSVALVGLFVAAGCTERPVHEPITLVFKHAKILGPSDPIAGLLREFEARHPGVRVRSEVLPWNSDEQHQFYVVNLEGGNPDIDVLMLDVIWVPEFARAGWLLDLALHVDASELMSYFPADVAVARHGGRVWSLPWFTNVGLLYYRKDLLDKYGLEPPGTYARLVEHVQLIRSREQDPRLDGFLWQGKQYEGMVVNVLEGFWANGTRLLDESGHAFPEPERAAEALAFLRRTIVSSVSPAWVTAADEELTRRAFQDGRAIFLRNWPYAMDLFEQPDSPVRGRVGIASLPRHAHGTHGAGSTGGAHLAVHRGTRHRDAAVALVRFLTGETAERAMAAGAALSPSRPALYHDPDLVKSHPSFPAIHALAMAGRPRPVTPAYLMLSTVLQPELSAALVGIKTPREAVVAARYQIVHVLASVR